MKKTIFYTAVILTVIFMLCFAGSVIHYTKAAMEMCYEIIIPTLFPFFVCSGLLIYSGFGSVLAKAASGFMRPAFNVAPSGAAAFVLGIISGFPLGAVTAVQLYECGSLSKSEAERLLAFCNNSGPLFIIGSVGTAIYSKPIYGIALYAIHIVSSLLTGIAFRFYGKNRHNSPPMRLDTNEMPLTTVFATALTNAAKNIITVCFAIIFFSAICRAVLDLTPLSPVLYAIASGICEFSTGTLNVSMLDLGVYEKLVLTAFILGFSGISVHVQVMAAAAGSGLSLTPYILGKCLQGIISAALAAAVLLLLPISAPAFSGGCPTLSASFAIIPLLIAASATFVFILFLVNRLTTLRR